MPFMVDRKLRPLVNYLKMLGIASLGSKTANETTYLIYLVFILFEVAVLLSGHKYLEIDSFVNMKKAIQEETCELNASIDLVESLINSTSLICSSLELDRNWHYFFERLLFKN